MITVDIDIKSLTRGLTDLQQKQIPFAASKALNALGLDVQVKERLRLREVFTLRREAWADRSIKMTHFAKKTELWATVAISPPGGASRSDIFGKFETDTEKRPFSGSHIAIPIGAKRTKGDIVRANQRPKNMHLHSEGGRIVGDNGTYIVKLKDGRQLLLQRGALSKGRLNAARGLNAAIGAQYQRGRNAAGQFTGYQHAHTTSYASTLLYLFTPRVQIHPDLQYARTASEVIERMYARRFDEALTAALATAR